MDCAGCWNYNNCENRNRKDLVACFRKEYTCKYCNRVECEFYNTETRCICTDFLDDPNIIKN